MKLPSQFMIEKDKTASGEDILTLRSVGSCVPNLKQNLETTNISINIREVGPMEIYIIISSPFSIARRMHKFRVKLHDEIDAIQEKIEKIDTILRTADAKSLDQTGNIFSNSAPINVSKNRRRKNKRKRQDGNRLTREERSQLKLNINILKTENAKKLKAATNSICVMEKDLEYSSIQNYILGSRLDDPVTVITINLIGFEPHGDGDDLLYIDTNDSMEIYQSVKFLKGNSAEVYLLKLSNFIGKYFSRVSIQDQKDLILGNSWALMEDNAQNFKFRTNDRIIFTLNYNGRTNASNYYGFGVSMMFLNFKIYIGNTQIKESSSINELKTTILTDIDERININHMANEGSRFK